MAIISEQFIRSLQPSDKRQMIMDEKLPGFGVRINKTGLVYIYRYRIGKKQGIFKIGPVSSLSAGQAREKARKVAGDVAHGIDPGAARDSQRNMPSFKTYAQQYLETTEKRSISDDAIKINNILTPTWGNRPIDSIRENDVRKVLINIKKSGRSPATVNRYRSLISTIFNRAIREGLCASNPATGIKPLPENNERVKWLTDAQVGLVLSALEKEPINARNTILLCLLTGRRRGDVIQMKWEDIDFENGFWHIPMTKDGRQNRVPLPLEVLEILRNQKNLRIAFNPYVFPGRHGKGHIKSVQRSWKRVADHASLEDFRLHDLRHNYASRLIQGKADLYLAAKLLGHSDLKTTKRYAHFSDESLINGANSVVTSISGLRKTKAGGD